MQKFDFFFNIPDILFLHGNSSPYLTGTSLRLNISVVTKFLNYDYIIIISFLHNRIYVYLGLPTYFSGLILHYIVALLNVRDHNINVN